MNRKALILVLAMLSGFGSIYAQTEATDSVEVKKIVQVKRLTLSEVIELAKQQSLQAILAQHRFRNSYWQYRTYRANYLPSLSFNSSAMPLLNKRYTKVTSAETGKDVYVPQNSMELAGGLSLSQNIGLTGGSISVNTNLSRVKQLNTDDESFVATPVSISINQPLSAYNALKWDRRISPLQYEQAKKTYIVNMEDVSSQAVRYFFDLASAQLRLTIAETNYQNSDTLYQISEGRYAIGTIAENELLRLKLSMMNASTSLNSATTELQASKARLRSFLNYTDDVEIELIVEDQVPSLKVDYNQVVELAFKNNPDIISQRVQQLQAEQNVAQTRSQTGFRGTLSASYGLNQRATDFSGAYKDPVEAQSLMISLNIPILDWGRAKGNLQMAKSNLQVTQTQVSQSQIEFEQDIFLQVMQFNLQEDQVKIAAQADTIGQRSYEVTKQRYLIGKVSVTDLNLADQDKDSARNAYLSALNTYWTYYYALRKLALFDFEKQQPLEADYDELIK